VFTIVVALSLQGIADQQSSQQTAPAAKSTAKAEVPPPIAVEVIAVDPKARTITVRDIAAVPAPPDKPVEITLPVPAAATGEKLSAVKAGQKVDVTCTIKPTVHPAAGVPIVLTDCARVIKIEPSK
jgi:NADPH-dependent 2,4-dienoyl-CoA reductase/sulfur reductase-like enzyme